MAEGASDQDLLAQADEAIDAGDLAAAQELLERLLQREPDHPGALTSLAQVAFLRDDAEGGLAQLSRVVEAAPRHLLGWLNRGDALAMLGQPEAARADFERLIELAPEDPIGFLRLGHLHLALGETAAALSAFRQALERDGDDPEAHNGAGLALEQEARYEEALTHYRRVTELDPDSPTGWLNSGDAHLGLGDPAAALAEYRRVTELAPELPQGHQRLGDAQMALEDWDEARDAYRRALALDAADPDLHTRLAVVLANQGDLDQALAHFDEVVRLAPESPVAWDNRASVRLARDEPDAAIADLRRLAELLPDSPEPLRRIGDVYLDREQPAEALAAFREALVRDPDDPDSHHRAALTLAATGDLAPAIDHADRVVELASDSPIAWGHRGDLRLATGSRDALEAALADFRHAAELDPESPLALRRQGDVYLAMDRPDEALAAYRQALERDADDLDAQNGAGLALETLGRFDEALAHYRRVTELDPEFPTGWFNRADAHLALEDAEAALAEYRRVVELAPELTVGHIGLARAHLQMDHAADALAACRTALDKDPDDPDAHYWAGMALEEQQAYAEALEHYRRITQLVPDSPLGWLQVGAALLQIEPPDPQAAHEAFSRVIELAPDESGAYYGRALACEALEKHPAALADLDRHLELEPESPSGHAARGRIRFYLQEYDLAREALEEALAQDADEDSALLFLSLICEIRQQHDEALKHSRKLVAVLPEEATSHERLGSAWLNLSAFESAVEEYREATRLDPGDGELWVGLADALRLCANELEQPDKRDEALAAADAAIRCDDELALGHALRGAILADRGSHDEAMECFARALEIDPDDSWCLRQKIRSLHRQGDLAALDEALAELAEAGSDLESLVQAGRLVVLRGRGQPDAAEQIFDELASRSTQPDRDYFDLGEALVELEAWPDAVAAFIRSIEIGPSNAEAHNELAWYQADKLGKNLEACTEHASFAVSLAESDEQRGGYLDTLGWVWFLRKEPDKALEHLRQAAQLAEWDAVIQQRLAKVEAASRDRPRSAG